MRSTVRIDDDLMIQLKARARKENVSLTRMLNRALRKGLNEPQKSSKSYREQPVALGQPRAEIDKALVLAADLEDEEILRKIALKR